MSNYRKLLVAFIGLVLVAVNTFFDIGVGFEAEQAANVVISFLTAVGVWAAPNDPA